MIHRYWTGRPATNAEWMRRALVSLNPGEELRDWTDETLPPEVVAWLDAHDPDVLPADRPRHRSNLVRLWALNAHGGWWVDHDVVMLRPFARLRFPAIASHVGRAASCVWGMPAGHPMLATALGLADRHPGHPCRCPDVSGDRMLEKARRMAGADVAMLPLPFDGIGRATGADPFAVHLYATTGAGA